MSNRIQFGRPCSIALMFFVAFGSNLVSNLFGQGGPIPEPIVKGTVRIELEEIGSNLVAPLLVTHANDASGRLFIVDQPGEILLIKKGELQPTPYLDIKDLIVILGGIIDPFQDPFSDFDERGLLGLAFHPNFGATGAPGFGKFYTYTSEPVDGLADFTVELPPNEQFNHQSVIREWTVDPSSDVIEGSPDKISRILMKIDQPQFNHDGGTVAFGNDHSLYISLGDGGAARDDAPGHGKIGNGQDPTNVLGTILRIDPLGNNSSNGQYGIPSDNPFVDADIVDEIYAFGCRNPFRFCVHQPIPGGPDVLIVADVGQSNIEEITVVNAGDNLGWRLKEGTFFYNHMINAVSEEPFDEIPIPPDFFPKDPVMQYDHDEGISVIGGYVYRGSEIPELTGKYVFGDFSRAFFMPDGRLFFGDFASGEIKELVIGLDDRDLDLFVKGFGEDAEGELYLLAGINLGPFRDENGNGFGQIFKIVKAPPLGDVNQDGIVNLLDVAPFVTLLNNGGFQIEADINMDGMVDLLDVAPFVDLLAGA